MSTRTRKPQISWRKTFPGRGVNTEISPLRCASVEMTKGRGALPWESGRGQREFFLPLGGPQAHEILRSR
jgi:hypothetical protein